jgi:hypothetical protein
VPNKVTIEVKAACGQLVDNTEYRKQLARRLIAGKLAPALECMLWHYAKGKPIERVEVKDARDVRNLSDNELVAELHVILEKA